MYIAVGTDYCVDISSSITIVPSGPHRFSSHQRASITCFPSRIPLLSSRAKLLNRELLFSAVIQTFVLGLALRPKALRFRFLSPGVTWLLISAKRVFFCEKGLFTTETEHYFIPGWAECWLTMALSFMSFSTFCSLPASKLSLFRILKDRSI